ncbi:MAG: LemA protein [Parcubacteria group bacterium Gr01-1014_33]|nr:MAG: LemA protein [Parcubacteria group bacterium Gr01-1014_33]
MPYFSYIIIGIAALVIISFIAIYNGLVRKRNQAEEAWSDIEVQLKRRYDLIPNVVETVKGYAGHEKGVLESVTQARTQAMGAQNAEDHAKAENMLTSTLKTLFAVAENYPDLKANVNFLDLQRELADTENKIQSARRFYNGTVRDFNIAIETFPSTIIAGMFGFTRKQLFDLEEGSPAQEPVKVKF